MGPRLTKKQALILDFIRDFTESRGFSPSYREIAAGLGLRSVSAISEHIDNLVTKGVLIKEPGEARSLTIVDASHPGTVALFRSRMAQATPDEREILWRAAEILGIVF